MGRHLTPAYYWFRKDAPQEAKQYKREQGSSYRKYQR